MEKPRKTVIDFGGGHVKKYVTTADEINKELDQKHFIDWVELQDVSIEPSRSGIGKQHLSSFRLIVNGAVVFSTNIKTVFGHKLYMFGASFSPLVFTGRDTFCAEIELRDKISKPFVLTCWLGYHYFQDVEIKKIRKKPAKRGKGK